MNTELQFNIKNNYHVELIEASTGKVKQAGDFHNLLTNGVGKCITGANEIGYVDNGSDYATCLTLCRKIAVGSGTNEPTSTDTALGNQLWKDKATLESFEWLTDYSARTIYSITFPATSEYVGSITEVGLFSGHAGYNIVYGFTVGDGPMTTHALLTDSEGQVISFNKTDLDILKVTVTVELTISSLSSDFDLIKRCAYIHRMIGRIEPNSYSYYKAIGYINLCRFHNMLDNFYGIYDGENSPRTTIEQVLSADSNTYRTNSRTGYAEYIAVRLGADTIASERYYKAVALPGIGYWKLPNENIFPVYTITGLSIGTGDGVTMQFENPLGYFKKDTEIIYKNGTPLTRDVDYTINNMGNKDCLPEIAEFTMPDRVTTDAQSNTTLSSWVPFFYPTTATYITEGTRWFTNANPLYIEYDDEVTLNCLKCTGNLKYIQGTNGYGNLPTGTTFYLDYSTDGTEYIEIASVTTTGTAENSAFNLDFESTTAKYWRLRTSYTSYPVAIAAASNAEYYMTLNYKDPYIVFAEAPAEGDVLTMDVGMDVIMKNENFVVDVTARLDFSW